MTLRDILLAKGSHVLTTGPNATLDGVVQSLVENNCGSLVVCDPDSPRRVVGIITERDILRVCATQAGSLAQTRVAEFMTSDVVTGRADQSLDETMGLMTERRIRHLPVVEDGQLVGIVSIGDLVKAHHDCLTAENHYLKEYIQG